MVTADKCGTAVASCADGTGDSDGKGKELSKYSSKVSVVVEEIRKVLANDPAAKILVFSQVRQSLRVKYTMKRTFDFLWISSIQESY